MTCILIEDEIHWRGKLQILLDDLGVEILGVASTVAEADVLLKKNIPNFVVADILLGDELVFDLYKLNIKYCNISTLFLTVSDKEIHYKQAKLINSHLYIVKPIHKLTLKSAIETLVGISLSNYDSKKVNSIKIKGKYNESIEIPFEKIIYLSQELKYCTIHTINKSFVIKKSMQDVERLLNDKFLRVHMSYCINSDYLLSVGIGMQHLKLKDKDIVIPIGVRFVHNLKNYIAAKEHMSM